MNKPPDETLKQGRNRSWLLVKFVKFEISEVNVIDEVLRLYDKEKILIYK